MKQLIMVRPYPDKKLRINEFLNGGFIAVSDSATGDLSGFTKANIKMALESKCGYTGHKIISPLAALELFVNTMQRGDLTLVPNGDDVYVAEIKSDYYFNDECVADNYAHQRKVRWIKKFSRSDLPKGVIASLQYLGTAADFTKHIASIEELLNKMSIKMKTVYYPLRTNLNAEIQIPEDITASEADRLSLFVKSLHFEK